MKEEILQTSLGQFLKYGIREMSIQKLVGPLRISRKPIYKYFKNKEELLEEALNLFQAPQFGVLNNLTITQNVASQFLDVWQTSVEIEYQINRTFFIDQHYYYPELAIKVENAINKKFKNQFFLVIQRGIKEASLRKQIVPKVVLEEIFTLYKANVRTKNFNTFCLPPFEIALHTISIYIRGFCKGSVFMN